MEPCPAPTQSQKSKVIRAEKTPNPGASGGVARRVLPYAGAAGSTQHIFKLGPTELNRSPSHNHTPQTGMKG